MFFYFSEFGKTDMVQSKLFITSFVITEYSISDIKLLGTDLFPLKFPLYNRIFTYRHRQYLLGTDIQFLLKINSL